MANHRIEGHPILSIGPCASVAFYWQDQPLMACEGETIASALFANGVRVFGHHHKDGAPQGIFCANGQCAECLVLAEGRPVKACMELVQPEAHIMPLDGLSRLPFATGAAATGPIDEVSVPVLIIGGGPAGLSAACELGQRGIAALLIDDKQSLGGKLVLQTHRFFGSTNAVYAGTRGIDIAIRLEKQVRSYPGIEIWLNSTALAVFSDGRVGVLRHGREYLLVKPQALLVAAGAREKSLAFRGNSLPGVYGAGAFQTLVNRDLVRAARRLFIVGGGNVGLIAGYHALQAGVEVVGLVEALPEVGGYKVHKDKLVRLGVPVYTSHTILSANPGLEGTVKSVTVARVDAGFRPIIGTERSFNCDTVLVAVGLDPVNEFYLKAKEFGMPAFAAGDAEEIAEASAAMFSGKIRGLEIAAALGHDVGEVPPDWYHTAEVMKSKPGRITAETAPEAEEGVFPVLHCVPGDPLQPLYVHMPQQAIAIDPGDIRALPRFIAEQLGKQCIACEKCVTICPGLAVTLVDYRKDAANPIVVVPYEFQRESIKPGDVVTVLDTAGNVLGNVPVVQPRAQSQRPHHRRAAPGAEGDRQANRRHSRAGDPGDRADGPLRRRLGPDGRCDHLSLRTRARRAESGR